MTVGQSVSRPLSKDEQALIRAAEGTVWSDYRNIRVRTHDTCGDLVDALELAGKGF